MISYTEYLGLAKSRLRPVSQKLWPNSLCKALGVIHGKCRKVPKRVRHKVDFIPKSSMAWVLKFIPDY